MAIAASAVGAIGSAVISSRASRRAQSAQEGAGQAGVQQTREGADIGQRAIEAGRAGGRRDLIQGRTRARQFLQPSTEFGTGQIGALEDILTSEGQLDFLEDNPIFQAALRNANLGTNAASASQGRFRAGGTAQELFQNFLSTSFPLLQSQTQNLFQAARFGERGGVGQANITQQTARDLAQQAQQAGANIANIRTGEAANISNLQAGIGDVQAAGNINRANIFGGAIENVTGLLPGILDQFQRRRQQQQQTGIANPAPTQAGPGGANF